MSGTITPAVGWLTEDEKVQILLRCGYPAYGWLNTFDPFSLYFPSYSQYRVPAPTLDDRMASVLTQVRAKLAELASLDAAIVQSSCNLGVGEAGTYKRNPNELRDRRTLMTIRCRELCTLMGVEAGPALSAGGTIRLVV